MKSMSHFLWNVVVICVVLMSVGCATPVPPPGTVVVHKIPILGSIPVIGWLFRHTDSRPQPQSSSTTSPANAVTKQTVSAVSPDQNSIPSRLKKLKGLKDAGIITEEEYQTQRKVLIEKL